MSDLLPTRHFAVSTAAGGSLWAVTGEPAALPVTVAAGVLVDVDHIPDYLWADVLKRRPIASIFFHGWEWLGALVVLGIWKGFSWWLLAVVVGYGLHVVGDHAFNHHNPWDYFVVYRARHRFKVARLDGIRDHTHSHAGLLNEMSFVTGLLERWRGRKPED